MSNTSEDKRKKRRWLLLLLVFLLAILAVIFLLFRLNGDSSSSAPTAASSASAPASSNEASDVITAPGLPALEAYANGTSIGWQVTANSNDGGSPYAGYEIELISETKDIHADFPGNGSGAGMYAWTFGGQPTVMARTYNEAGLTSEWVAMLLPVVDPADSTTLDESADPATKKKQPSPSSSASAANREKPLSLIGENPETILSLPLLPPVITGGVPAVPLRPADMPTPSATPTEMPVTPAPTCTTGQELKNGACVPVTPTTCEQGKELKNGACVPVTPTEPKCKYGQKKDGSCKSGDGDNQENGGHENGGHVNGGHENGGHENGGHENGGHS